MRRDTELREVAEHSAPPTDRAAHLKVTIGAPTAED